MVHPPQVTAYKAMLRKGNLNAIRLVSAQFEFSTVSETSLLVIELIQ